MTPFWYLINYRENQFVRICALVNSVGLDGGMFIFQTSSTSGMGND